MNPQAILYAITIIGGAALAVYTTYKQYQSQYETRQTYTYDDYRRRRRYSRPFNRGCEDCTICLESMGEQLLKRLDCGHIFHEVCLTKWLNLKKDCPNCRAKAQSA